MYALQVGAAPDHLPIVATRLFQEHRQNFSDAGLVELAFLFVQRQLQGSETIGLRSLGNLAGSGCCGRAGPLGIFERVRLGKTDLVDEVERSLEVLIAFARETDDEVGRESEIRAGKAQALNDAPIGIGGMTPVHSGEDTIRTALHRKMNVGHQLSHIAVGGDQLIVDISRMRGRVADATETGQAGELTDKSAKPAGPAVRTLPVIRVYILAEKSDLSYPRRHHATRLRQNLRDRTRVLRAARIGDDAEAAELVASFLDREKGRHSLLCRRFRQVVKFGLDRKIRGKDAAAGSTQGPGDQFRKQMVALWAEHEVNERGSSENLGTLGLRDAATDRDDHVIAAPRLGFFQLPEQTELGIYFFDRFFTNVAGIK